MITAWQRYRSLKADDRALALEAAAALMIARAGLPIASFATLRRWLSLPLMRRVGSHARRESVDGIGWAVSAVARRLPLSTTCLTKALAADAMLRRRGFKSEVRFGVHRSLRASRPLQAHAWVECEGRIVVGELEDLSDYVPLTAGGGS